MDVSKNRGKTPKSSIFIGFGTIIKHPFCFFSTVFWKHPYNSKIMYIKRNNKQQAQSMFKSVMIGSFCFQSQLSQLLIRDFGQWAKGNRGAFNTWAWGLGEDIADARVLVCHFVLPKKVLKKRPGQKSQVSWDLLIFFLGDWCFRSWGLQCHASCCQLSRKCKFKLLVWWVVSSISSCRMPTCFCLLNCRFPDEQACQS